MSKQLTLDDWYYQHLAGLNDIDKAWPKAKKDLAQLVNEIIGEERGYSKYEPCPRCSQPQYSCSCDTAEDILMTEQRARAKELGVDLEQGILKK